MKKHVTGDVKIKAAGGVKNLDDILRVMALGVERVGASATKQILEEARERGVGSEKKEVEVPEFPAAGSETGGY